MDSACHTLYVMVLSISEEKHARVAFYSLKVSPAFYPLRAVNSTRSTHGCSESVRPSCPEQNNFTPFFQQLSFWLYVKHQRSKGRSSLLQKKLLLKCFVSGPAFTSVTYLSHNITQHHLQLGDRPPPGSQEGVDGTNTGAVMVLTSYFYSVTVTF